MLSLKVWLCVVLAAAAMLAAAPAFALVEIGGVERIEPTAFGTPPGLDRRNLQLDIPVHRDELIETVAVGEVSIRFVDGTRLGLGANSTVVLDELIFEGNGGDALQIMLTAGLFHFVTGDIDASRVVIVTPTASIGIRGTDIGIQVLADGTTSLAVLEGLTVMTAMAGGMAVEIAAGQTGTVRPGASSVEVSEGLPDFALAGLPAVGATDLAADGAGDTGGTGTGGAGTGGTGSGGSGSSGGNGGTGSGANGSNGTGGTGDGNGDGGTGNGNSTNGQGDQNGNAGNGNSGNGNGLGNGGLGNGNGNGAAQR